MSGREFRKTQLMRWRDAIRDSDASWKAKLVGYTLATYANGRGQAWPSQETLAAKSGISRRAAQYALTELEATGFVTYAKRSTGRGSHIYQIVIPAGFEEDAPEPTVHVATATAHGTTA